MSVKIFDYSTEIAEIFKQDVLRESKVIFFHRPIKSRLGRAEGNAPPQKTPPRRFNAPKPSDSLGNFSE